ncbi:efflux transporter periplasmic adaptor subunit [Rhodoferax lacus]|uniref:Efflux transporter periplasmic adaptor subunit n=1 Tax=Rhodoferax lacus TaxID=2184758 RepID=A0A3E1RDM0_9BURK|nr:efflux RND transporter periplasmic adaptor subunit [Rhodoferax lacus]RFO97468.1 efflux transporter periplasmic adaptor subunit [Rhodoferax lacus]
MHALKNATVSFLRRADAHLLMLGAAGLLAACGQSAAPPAAAGNQAPPPAQVGVVTVSRATVGLQTELPGRTEASRVAQVRARVAGILEKQLFREGSEVRANQTLFQIDASPYKATLAGAQAALARAEANLTQAQAQAERYKPLAEANAISKQEMVAAVAAQKLAEADVAAAKASIQSAQINVGYATVTTPISGRIGRALVTEGALVGQGDATPLALVQQINPMYVNFTQPVADVLRLRAAIASGALKSAGGADAAQVRIVLDDGSVYPLAGKLLFSDLSVDPTSGQITLRAEVPNPKGVLLPGMYVRAQLQQAAVAGAILLPQQAVQRTSQGDSVKVVGADGMVETRTVKVGSGKNNQWVVLSGLNDGEQVVVDGFQKMQGKAPVKGVPWTPPGAAPAGGTASAPAAVGSAPAAATSAPAVAASAAAKP